MTDAGHPSGTVVRSYVVNDAGSVVKLIIPAGETGAGTYLVTWNGHGDALGLWRIETSGSVTLANSFTYSTWGLPTTSTHNSIADLGFRFLYVGEFDVQWDTVHGLGLHYMHARHYSPAIGRFIQPDPDGSEANLYAYAANNPVTEIDPSGTCFIICAIVNAVVDTAIYLATTDSSQWSLQGAATAAVTGAVTGFLGVGLLSKFAKAGSLLSKLPKAISGYERVRSARPDAIVRLASQRVYRAGPSPLARTLSIPQRLAGAKYPSLGKSYMGTAYHNAVARQVSTISRNRIQYNRMGMDFVEARRGIRVELTTRGQVARHVARPGYGPPSYFTRYVKYDLW